MEAAQPWAKALKDLGCKVGPGNWTNWKRLVDEHTSDRVVEVAKGLPAGVRWDDRVEEALKASRGQTPLGSAVAHKIKELA